MEGGKRKGCWLSSSFLARAALSFLLVVLLSSLPSLEGCHLPFLWGTATFLWTLLKLRWLRSPLLDTSRSAVLCPRCCYVGSSFEITKNEFQTTWSDAHISAVEVTKGKANTTKKDEEENATPQGTIEHSSTTRRSSPPARDEEESRIIERWGTRHHDQRRRREGNPILKTHKISQRKEAKKSENEKKKKIIIHGTHNEKKKKKEIKNTQKK